MSSHFNLNTSSTNQFQDITKAQLAHAGWNLDNDAIGELESSHKIYVAQVKGVNQLDIRLLAMPMDAFDSMRLDFTVSECADALNAALRQVNKKATANRLNTLSLAAFAYFKQTQTYRMATSQHGYTDSFNGVINIYGKPGTPKMVARPAMASMAKAIEPYDVIKDHCRTVYAHDLTKNPGYFL